MNFRDIIITVLLFFVLITTNLMSCHKGYNQGIMYCINTVDTLPYDTNNVLTIYISDDLGIAYIYFEINKIYFENGDDPLEFKSREDMYNYISEMTAYSSSIIGYQHDIDFNIRNGYIYTHTVYNEDKQYTELIYSGPNWTIDAQQDTTYLISTFNNVEKLYDPNTKTTWYESYTVD